MTKHERLTLTATVLGSGLVVLDGTIVNVALPAIASSLHTGYAGLQWIVDGYLLTLSALILLGGSLGDIFGEKRLFQTGVIGFALTSLFCGLAPSIEMLTAGRLLQGIFGALLVPASLAIINTSFPPERRGQAIGSWTALGAIFPAIGPLAGGLLISLSWRWIFLLNLPLAIACLIFISRGVNDTKPAGRGPAIDALGALLATIGLGGATFGLIEGPAHGWHAAALSVLILGLAALVAFVFHESQHPHPMLPLDLFRSRNFTGANLATLGMYAALGGAIFSIILYLQTAVGYNPLAAGLAFLPTTLIMFFFASRAGKLSAIYGPRLFMTLGPIIAALGFLLLLRVSPSHHDYILDLLPGILVFSAGLALTVAPLTTTVMTSVDNNRSGIASAVNNAVARLAGLFIVAFLGIIVATETTNSLNILPHGISPQANATVQQAIATGLKPAQLSSVPSQDQPTVQSAVTKAQRATYVDAILINAALAFFAGLISFALVQNRKPKPRQP